MSTEQSRFNEACEQAVPWRKWGLCLSERQWGTVREDLQQQCQGRSKAALTKNARRKTVNP